MDAALELEELATQKYSGEYFLDEMKGMSDSTGIDLKVNWFDDLEHFKYIFSFCLET